MYISWDDHMDLNLWDRQCPCRLQVCVAKLSISFRVKAQGGTFILKHCTFLWGFCLSSEPHFSISKKKKEKKNWGWVKEREKSEQAFWGEDFGTGSLGAMAASAPSSSSSNTNTTTGGGGGEPDPNSTNLRPPGSSKVPSRIKMLLHVCYLLCGQRH